MQKQSYRLREMDKKRWFVRYIILASIATILAVKVYFLTFLVDPIVGIYSFLTSFILFNLFFFAYFKYKDPFIEAENIELPIIKPLVSIIVPVRNEEDNIENCVLSCLKSTYSNKEVIIINDASTDKTGEILDRIKRDYSDTLNIVHLEKNVGKKHAIEQGTKIAKGDFYVFMDSDCNMADDAVENIVKIFISDKNIGALTAHGRVRDAQNGNILQKIQDVWFDGQFRILKGMESSFSSLTCCSGALSAFRREAIQAHMYEWAHDKFLGSEFKFATDRRLTAFVLGAKKNRKNQNNSINYITNQENNDNCPFKWKLKYSPSIKVYVGVPENITSLIKQQIRWRKSFIRSIFATGGIYWRRPFPAALLYYLILALKLFRPYIIIKALILLPLAGDIYTATLYIGGALFSGMMYGIDVRLRNPGFSGWLYRPLMTLISTFILSWLIIYAAITIKNKSWR